MLLHDFFAAGPRRIFVTAQATVRDRIEERLPRMAMPVLIVRGACDPLVPQYWAEEATGLLPQGQLVVLPGAALVAIVAVLLAHLHRSRGRAY